MRNVLRGALLAALVALSTGASLRPAACDCVYAGAPCEAAWDSPLVFAGTVKAITGRRVTFTVDEAFRGPDSPEIDLIARNTSCDYWFEAGEAYLVYAHNVPNGPGWTTGSCTRTGKLSERQEDLAYLRLADAEKGTSRIIGRVMHQDVPLPGVRVRAIGDQGYGVTTGPDGRYTIYVWPHRSYEVVFDNPTGLVIRGGRDAIVSAPRACRSVDGYARYDGRIAGCLTDADGKPVPRFPLRIEGQHTVGVGGLKLDALTRPDGTFEFDEVQPGSYQVLAHGTATDVVRGLSPAPLAVGPSARIDAGTLVLPPTESPTLIEVSVVDADGRAAPDVMLRVTRPRSGESPFGLKSDAKGRFLMSVSAGGTFLVSALRSRHDESGYFIEGASETVKAAGATKVTLRLARTR